MRGALIVFDYECKNYARNCHDIKFLFDLADLVSHRSRLTTTLQIAHDKGGHYLSVSIRPEKGIPLTATKPSLREVVASIAEQYNYYYGEENASTEKKKPTSRKESSGGDGRKSAEGKWRNGLRQGGRKKEGDSKSRVQDNSKKQLRIKNTGNTQNKSRSSAARGVVGDAGRVPETYGSEY